MWKLLDACIQEALEEAQRDEDDRSPTSDDVVAQTHLSPGAVHQFLSKLDVRVVPSSHLLPPSPLRRDEVAAGKKQQQRNEQAADSRSPRHGEGTGKAAGEVSSFMSVRNAFEARSKGSRSGSPVRTRSPTPSSSSSQQFVSNRSAFEGNTRGTQEEQPGKGEAPAPSSPPSVCDRYLRALSRDTASVRCRMQFYNQELARTIDEAQSLVSGAAAINLNDRESCGQPLPPSRYLNSSAAARRGIGGGGGGSGGEPVVAEVGGGMEAVNGGGGGGARPLVTFSRVSPVGRADPSHPRMELMSRPGSTSPAPSPSTIGGHAQDPCWANEIPPKAGGGGRRGQVASADGSRRSSGGDATKVAVSSRVAKLLLAALDETKAHSAAPPAAPERRKIAAAPKTACFDPPSVRNGLAGLTPDHVDKVLLRVEASTPGAVSSWKSPVGRRRPRTGGTEVLTPSTVGLGLAAEERSRRRRQLNISHDGSIGWFDAEGSPRRMLQEAGSQGAAGEGSRPRKKKGGGGARRKRSILKIKLPPRTPTKKHEETGAVQAAPPATTRRKSS